MAGKVGSMIALLTGVAIGATIGILYAPDEGARTRRKIREGYGEKKDELKDKLNELSEQVKNKFGMAKMDLEKGFDELVSSVEDKKDDVIATLEKKLEQLKKEAKKATS